MLLTITTTHRPATDLGYLLHKHPDRFQSFDLSFGKAHVFYPEVGADRCTACLLLDVDAVGMVRGKNPDQSFLLGQYVNDRPYAASSFMSVAIAQVFGSALQGRCKDRPELVGDADPARRPGSTCCRCGAARRFLRAMFEPLGYEVEAVRYPLDERFPEWGESPYFSVTVRKTTTLARTADAPVRPDPGVRQPASTTSSATTRWRSCSPRARAGWPGTREKEEIARRYLRFQPSLFRMALARLVVEEEPVEGEDETPDEGEGRGVAGKAAQPQRAAARGGHGGAAGERGQAGARPRLRRGQAAPGTAQGQAVRGDRRHGRVDPHPGSRRPRG